MPKLTRSTTKTVIARPPSPPDKKEIQSLLKTLSESTALRNIGTNLYSGAVRQSEKKRHPSLKTRFLRLSIALFVIILIFSLRTTVFYTLFKDAPFLILTTGVLVASLIGGLAAGLLATITLTLGAYLLLLPAGPASFEQLLQLAIFLVEGFLISFINYRRGKQLVSSQNLVTFERLAQTNSESEKLRFSFLAGVTSLFSSTLNLSDILDSLSHLLVPTIADWCVIDLVNSNGQLERVSAYHRMPTKQKIITQLYRYYPPDFNDNHPIMQTIKTGKTQLASSVSPQDQVARAKDKRHLALLESLKIGSHIVVPLVSRRKVYGAVSLVRDVSHQPFLKSDVPLAEDLARRVGLAIDNARLYDSSQKEINQRKKVEQELATSHEQLTTIFKSISDAFVALDQKGNFTYLNQKAETFLRSKLLIGQNMWTTFPQTLDSGFADKIRTAIRTGRPTHFEEFFPRLGYWYLVHAYPHKNAGVSIYFSDITQIKKAEAELRRSRDQLNVILKNVADGITVQDKSGALIYVNDAAAKIMGFPSAKTLLSTPISQIMSNFKLTDEEGNPLPVSALPGRIALTGKSPAEVTLRFVFAHDEDRQEYWSVVRATPVFDDHHNVQYAINVFQNITEQKALERRKDEFIAMASHELKTPLTSIKAFAQIAQRHVNSHPDPKLDDYLSKMDQQIDRLSHLVADLLDVTRIRAGKLQLIQSTFDLNELVSEVLSEFRPTTSHPIIFKPAPPVKVLADRARTSQVLINLLSNAAKYSPASTPIKILISKQGNFAQISVKDEGVGISKVDQKKIFTRFYQADLSSPNRPPGLGLGLYISSEIVRRQGGQISVASKEGKGSTFSFTILLAK